MTRAPLHVHRNPAYRPPPPRDRTGWLLALCVLVLATVVAVLSS